MFSAKMHSRNFRQNDDDWWKIFFFFKNLVEWAHFDPALSSCKQCSTCFECSNLSLSFTTHYFTKNISSDSYELRIWNKLSQNQLFHTFVKKLISLLLAHAINVEAVVVSSAAWPQSIIKITMLWRPPLFEYRVFQIKIAEF